MLFPYYLIVGDLGGFRDGLRFHGVADGVRERGRDRVDDLGIRLRAQEARAQAFRLLALADQVLKILDLVAQCIVDRL
ncbi:hypothetical protein [Bradyrhizobium iriomotense]|uniref:Uncharacterized protein n=1 Tax=Bradyrhizobium iriomotense TaxID=441950 RepID=A0ABQ6AP50_9BRAD|nr:hypothetical protein [Bradyrhizobium iriomotense]GLR84043.1 hypothetical protein GCM10007857_07530 [Bradyrhizobium iriomotense]